jgi:hypothetical protein
MLGLAQNLVRTAPSGNSIIGDITSGNFSNVLYDMREVFLGIDANGQFHFDWVASAYVPVVVGFLGSKIMTTIGVNKAMKRVPLIGKRIKL